MRIIKHYNNIQGLEDRNFSRGWYKTVPGFLSGLNKKVSYGAYNVGRAASKLGHDINQATGGRIENAMNAIKSAKKKIIKSYPHFATDPKEPLRNLTDYQIKRKTLEHHNKVTKFVNDAKNNPQKAAGQVVRAGVENPLLGALYGSAALGVPGAGSVLKIPGINGATIALGRYITPVPVQLQLRKLARADYRKIGNNIKNNISNASNNIKNSISNASNNIKNSISNVSSNVSDKVNTLKDRVKNFLNIQKQQPKP